MPNPENVLKHKVKKGTVLNPKGRPKGALNRRTILRNWLSAKEKSTNPITHSHELLTQADLIVLAQIKAAKNGSTPAFNALMEQCFGKLPQEIKGDIDGGMKLIIERRIINGSKNNV